MSSAVRFEGVASLGECTIDSPLISRYGPEGFLAEDARIMSFANAKKLGTDEAICFGRAGQRRKIFHDPSTTAAGIVTCGGLCPGLNNVIRSAVYELRYNYGVKTVWGFRYGYAGLNPAMGHDPVDLTCDRVEHINRQGGTILGSSRGNQEPAVMADTLQRMGVNVLLCIGGDGTQRGAHALGEEMLRRGAKVSIVGVPKTIDNDVAYCDRSFGFTTAVEAAAKALVGAHEEARGALNGIGLVKLMGRDAGFIAVGAAVASQEVNFVLVPEQPFKLEGANGLLALLGKRLRDRRHAVIAVAEGAGQDLFEKAASGTDASGNRKYQDIGPFLKAKIEEYFAAKKFPIAIKYMDPSYTIRAVPANTEDSVISDQYGRLAVHAAMSGRTDMVVCLSHGHFVHVSSKLVTSSKRKVRLDSVLWRAMLASTGQPPVMG
jgi:6-phosphofructokinase 1